MAETFSCPHCNATYPVKPALVGKAVRCTHCRKPFKLQEDGTAVPLSVVQSSASASKSTASAAPARPVPPPAEPRTGKVAAVGIGKESQQTESRSHRRTMDSSARADALKKSLSKSLSEAANEALKSEAVKRESVRLKKESQRQPGGSSSRRVATAILTGTGEREAKQNRHFLFASLIVVALIIGAWFTFSGESDIEQAFSAYEEPDVNNPEWRTRRRLDIIRSRCWVYQANGPVFAYLGDPKLGAQENIKLTNISAMLDKYVQDRVHLTHAGQEWWVKPQDIPGINKTLDTGAKYTKPERLHALLSSKGFDVLVHEDFLEELASNGLSADHLAIILDLFVNGATDAQGNNFIKVHALKNGWPAEIHLQEFSSNQGRLLLAKGQNNFRLRNNSAYTGLLLRFDGPGWTSWAGNKFLNKWHIYSLKISEKNRQ